MERKLTCNSFCLFLYSFLMMFYCLPVFAQFEYSGAGARGISMGNAFTALANDVYAIYYNPAGLARVRCNELTIDCGKPYWGLYDSSNLGSGFIGYAHCFDMWGTIGFGWLNFSADGYYNENTFIFAWGKQIANLSEKGLLSAGIKFKMLSKEYGKTPYTENAIDLRTGQLKGSGDPVFDAGYSRKGFSTSFGFLWNINVHNSIGLTLDDINQPDMGLSGEDKIYSKPKLGYAYITNKVNMTSDFVLETNKLVILGGIEKWFMDRTFALRGGLGIIGDSGFSNLSLGASWQYNKRSTIEYSFRYPLEGISTYGSHQISLALRFGVSKPLELDVEAEMERLKAELEKLKKESEGEISDIKSKLEASLSELERLKNNGKKRKQ